MTYYELLGVSDQATADEIKRAYRKLASQHHPDKGGDKVKFQEIQAAYNTLSDAQKRQQYDMQRNGFGGGPGVQFHWHSSDMNHPDINEIFRNFGFGGAGGDPFGPFRQRERRNKDLRIELPLDLVDTLADHTKTVSVQTTNGERTTLEVNVPRGVTTGTQIKYTGLGDNLFNTIPRGDLYVQFVVNIPEGFDIRNLDIHRRVVVNCLIAIVGGTTTITGIDGREFELTIPPGTQPGTRFRLAHNGLYQLNSSERGHLYLEMAVTVPTDLGPDQLEVIKNFIN
jgi:DnaJ-class molecular chaperone